MNGLINAGQEPHPGIRALKYMQQPVQFDWDPKRPRALQLTNRYDFTELDETYELRWSIQEEGTILKQGVIDLPCPTTTCQHNRNTPRKPPHYRLQKRTLAQPFPTCSPTPLPFWEKRTPTCFPTI